MIQTPADDAPAGETFEYTLELPGPPPPPLPDWASTPLCLAALAGVAMLARRRARRHQESPVPLRASRPRRIAAAGFGYGIVLLGALLPGLLVMGQDEPLGPLMLPPFKLADLSLVAGALAGASDLLLDPFALRRDRLSLLLAVPTVTLLIAAPLVAAGFGGGILRAPEPHFAAVAAGALGAALLWWSRLPAPGERVARVFD